MKAFTVPQAKAEILRRLAKSKVKSVSCNVRLGDTAQTDIDQAFRELRDEGRIFARGGRWYERGPAPRWGAEA